MIVATPVSKIETGIFAKSFYQTRQALTGIIGWPLLQPNA